MVPRPTQPPSSWARWRRLPVFNRVLIGNSVVIVAGAIGGTLLTRHLATQTPDDLWLIVVFAGLGILLSLGVNYVILRSTLAPLRELRTEVERVQAGQSSIDVARFRDSDPDTARLAVAIHSMLARLEDDAHTLRALSERALNAQEDERRRIARGLHDDTGQALSTLIIHLEHIESTLPAGNDELRARLASCRDISNRTLEELRKLVYGLRPTMLDDLGLVPAIRWYARSSLEGSGARLHLEETQEIGRLDPRLETALFRIAQEAVNNIVRHAQASEVRITLCLEEGDVCLRVADDGRGFDIDQISQQALPQRRLGLLGMRERVDLVGGRMRVDSGPGRGTRLEVRVPLAGMGNIRHEQ
jgi:two-component system sensor histidine kinase UhpB